MIHSPFCDYTAQSRFDVKRGVIVGFSKLSRGGLQAMKEDLCLAATVNELQIWQAEYAKKENLQPTLDEIFFLDGIARANHRSGDFIALSRVYLNDPEIIRTYRDLIKKTELLGIRREDTPPTLREFLSVLPKALARSGRQIKSEGAVLSADQSTAVSLAGLGYTPSASITESGIRIFNPCTEPFPSYHGTALDGDAMVLIFRKAEETESDDNAFLDALSRFAKTGVYRNCVHAAIGVATTGLAVALSYLSSGIYTELSRLPSMHDTGELYDLAYAEIGTLLVALPQDCAAKFAEDAAENGLSVVQIARSVRGTQFTVRREGHPPFSFRTAFLREFAETSLPFLARGSKSTAEQLAALSEHKLIPHVLREDRRIYVYTESSAHSFHASVCAMLFSILRALLSGANPDTLSVFETYSMPEQITADSIGCLLESVLGAYRVLAEAAVCGTAEILPHSDSQAPRYSVLCTASLASEHTIPTTFSSTGSDAYLLALRKNENGLPDFDEIRALFRLITKLAKEGTLYSALIGYNTEPMKTIRAMCGTNMIRYATGISAAALQTPTDGFHIVLETTASIDGATRLGKTEQLPAPIPPSPLDPL